MNAIDVYLRASTRPAGTTVPELRSVLLHERFTTAERAKGYELADVRRVCRYATFAVPDAYPDYVCSLGACPDYRPFRDATVEPSIVAETLDEYAREDPPQLVPNGLTIAVSGVMLPDAALVADPTRGAVPALWLSDGSHLGEQLADSLEAHLWISVLEQLVWPACRRTEERCGAAEWASRCEDLERRYETVWFTDSSTRIFLADRKRWIVASRRAPLGRSEQHGITMFDEK